MSHTHDPLELPTTTLQPDVIEEINAKPTSIDTEGNPVAGGSCVMFPFLNFCGEPMRSYMILLLLTLSATAYGQTEKFLLTELGTSEKRALTSARTILGPRADESSWVNEDNHDEGGTRFYSDDSSYSDDTAGMFGLPIKSVWLTFYKKKLERIDVALRCDSLEKAQAVYQRLLAYAKARLRKMKKGDPVASGPPGMIVIMEKWWQTRRGLASVQLVSGPQGGYWIAFGHRRVKR